MKNHLVRWMSILVIVSLLLVACNSRDGAAPTDEPVDESQPPAVETPTDEPADEGEAGTEPQSEQQVGQHLLTPELLAEFKAYVEQNRESLNVPGAAVAIVQGGGDRLR